MPYSATKVVLPTPVILTLPGNGQNLRPESGYSGHYGTPDTATDDGDKYYMDDYISVMLDTFRTPDSRGTSATRGTDTERGCEDGALEKATQTSLQNETSHTESGPGSSWHEDYAHNTLELIRQRGGAKNTSFPHFEKFQKQSKPEVRFQKPEPTVKIRKDLNSDNQWACNVDKLKFLDDKGRIKPNPGLCVQTRPKYQRSKLKPSLNIHDNWYTQTYIAQLNNNNNNNNNSDVKIMISDDRRPVTVGTEHVEFGECLPVEERLSKTEVQAGGKNSKQSRTTKLTLASHKSCRLQKRAAKSAPAKTSEQFVQIPSINPNVDPAIGKFEWTRWAELRKRAADQSPEAIEGLDVATTEMRVRFLSIIQKVFLIRHCFLRVLDLSDSMTVRSATEMQWFTINKSKEVQKLAFNKTLFSREKIQERVPLWAIRLASKAPDSRTERDCHKLHALLRGLKSFNRFTERIQLALCGNITYERVDSMRIILRKGHVGQYFYFLYSGSVFVNVDEVGKDGTKFVKTEVVLKRGDSFGELALLQDTPRSATIAVQETCELFVVNKQVFAKICPKIFERELKEKISFVSDISLFNNICWSDDDRRQMCMQAQIQEYKTNKIIVADAEADDWIYMCMEGKAKIIRHLCLKDSSHGERRDSCVSDHASIMTSQSLNIVQSLVNETQKHLINKDHIHRRRSSFRDTMPAEKTRLLQSMGLEYVMSDEDRLAMGDSMRSNLRNPGQIKGCDTLTSFMTQHAKLPGSENYAFLEVGELNPREIFDLEAVIFGPDLGLQRAFILVSSGAKMLRIKKAVFFRFAKEDALDHAAYLAKASRYPSTSVLLHSLKETEQWRHFKEDLVRDVIIERSSNKGTDSSKCYRFTPADPVTYLKRKRITAKSNLKNKKMEDHDKENGKLKWMYDLTLRKAKNTNHLATPLSSIYRVHGGIRHIEQIFVLSQSGLNSQSKGNMSNMTIPSILIHPS